jgi:hypothetical protein
MYALQRFPLGGRFLSKRKRLQFNIGQRTNSVRACSTTRDDRNLASATGFSVSTPFIPNNIHSDNQPLNSKHLLLMFLEPTIAGDELTAADRTFIHIATGNMELSPQNSAVVARNSICMPVVWFTSVSNAGDDFPLHVYSKNGRDRIANVAPTVMVSQDHSGHLTVGGNV